MKIFGYKYRVVEDIEVNNRAELGYADTDNYVLQIAVGMTEQQKISVVVHEIIEALKDHMGKSDLDHDLIDMFETLVFMALVDNGVDLRPLIKDIEPAVGIPAVLPRLLQ